MSTNKKKTPKKNQGGKYQIKTKKMLTRTLAIDSDIRHLLSLKFYVDGSLTTLSNICAIHVRVQRLHKICKAHVQEQARVLEIQRRTHKDAFDIRKDTEEELVAHARSGDEKTGVWIWNTRDAQIGYETTQRACRDAEEALKQLNDKKNGLWWDLQELGVMRRLLNGTSSPADLHTTRINTPLYRLLKKLNR